MQKGTRTTRCEHWKFAKRDVWARHKCFLRWNGDNRHGCPPFHLNSLIQKSRDKYFSEFQQSLDPMERDSESRRSITCGILLFPPSGSLWWCVHRLSGLVILSTTSWSHIMEVQVWSPSILLFPRFEYPGYWLLLGKPWHLPCRTNFVCNDSGCRWPAVIATNFACYRLWHISSPWLRLDSFPRDCELLTT